MGLFLLIFQPTRELPAQLGVLFTYFWQLSIYMELVIGSAFKWLICVPYLHNQCEHDQLNWQGLK